MEAYVLKRYYAFIGCTTTNLNLFNYINTPMQYAEISMAVK